MGKAPTVQAPLRLRGVGKREPRTQFAALCYRVKRGDVQVLLISSLESGRWIIPKGWPMDGLTPAGTAAREAWEEAGVTGKETETSLGLYTYTKSVENTEDLSVVVAVFAVAVKELADDFPEAGLRKRRWFSCKKAAARVREPELKRILRKFDPARLR